MRRAAYFLIPFAFSSGAVGQSNLTGQIDAVYAAQQHQEQVEQTARLTQEEGARRELQQNLRASRQRDNALTARRREIASASELKFQQAGIESRSAKKRDQDYQDQLRSVDLQEKLVQLQVEKARLARTNEYIDRDLRKQDAETDVIKSGADATRDVSSGTKTLLEKTGEAEIKAHSGIFH